MVEGKTREVPYCTIFLVTGALLCHTMVLVGNLKTSGAFQSIGESSGGWSAVGIGLARSLEGELDEVMANVTDKLTETIEKAMKAQEQLDSVIGVFGDSVDTAVKDSTSLLQTGGSMESTVDGIMDAIMKAFQALPQFQDATKLLSDFMDHAKPVLYQVGDWILTFADKVQAGIEAFGNTVDMVQKLFDQVMSQVAGGKGADIMVQQTFNLFDTGHTGFVNEQALHDVAELYSIPALSGKKAGELVDKYDEDGDNQLDVPEFTNFAEDEAVPGIMAVVLRAYAKKLAQVSGQVASAKLRDQVAVGIVNYLQLVSAKNITKVGWVAQRMSNGSVPMPFTGCLIAELALAADDPGALTKADVGGMVVGAMLDFNASYIMDAIDLLSDPAFFEEQGLNPDNQPMIIERVTNWTVTGPKLIREMRATLKALQFETGNGTALNSVDSEELLQTMPAAARRLTEKNMNRHIQNKHRKRMEKRRNTFKSETSQHLLRHLLGGVAACDGGNPDAAERALNAGVPAVPATLEFARWLSYNASTNAALFNGYASDYTGTSSGALDAFNTQISGMVKKTSSFIDMLKEHSTRPGVDKLVQDVLDFATKGVADIQKVVMKKVIDFVNKTMGGDGGMSMELRQNKTMSRVNRSSTSKIRTSANHSASKHNHTQEHSEHLVLRQSGRRLLHSYRLEIGQLPGGIDPDQIKEGAEKLYDVLNKDGKGVQLSDWKTLVASDEAQDVLEEIDVPGLDSDLLAKLNIEPFDTDGNGKLDLTELVQGLQDPATLKTLGASMGADALSNMVPSPIWDRVTTILRQLNSVLPTAIETLKFAKKEVSAVSAQLDNVFDNFQMQGPKIFNEIASLNSMAWTAYYCLLAPLTLGVLYYGFWASGFFGGPKKIDDSYEEPQGFMDRVRNCWTCCCRCISTYEDTTMCLWSMILIMQVVVLLVFIVSILLTVLAGVKVFMTAGCAQVYIINDDKVCTETMKHLGTFLETFHVGEDVTSLDFVCDVQQLKTCQMITQKMATSTIYTVVGSFAATIFSFELILNTAMLHERARWHRVMDKMGVEGEGEGE